MSDSDSWRTPDDLFNVLNNGGEYMGAHFEGYHFDIDLCATEYNSKCDMYCVDYLNDTYQHVKDSFLTPGKLIFTSRNIDKDLDGDTAYSKDDVTCFMNPPYSNPWPFITKAWEDARFCRIVCLVKCDPSTNWWSTFWNYENKYSYPRCLDCSSCIECGCTSSGRKLVEKIGPKPGCEVLYFPKRIKFDPPIELVNSGEVWKEGKSWMQKCKECPPKNDLWEMMEFINCLKCKDKEYKKLSGPSFGCALIVMDRRGT